MRVQAYELRLELVTKRAEYLSDRVEEALEVEKMRAEEHAEVRRTFQRVVDEQTIELQTHHAVRIADLELSRAAIVAAKDATIAEQKDKLIKFERSHTAIVAARDSTVRSVEVENTKLKRWLIASWAIVLVGVWATRSHAFTVAARCETENEDLKTSLKADVMSRLSAIHASVTTLTLEMHPARLDQRQFITWHAGPVPPLYVFDRAWADAAVLGDAPWGSAATGPRANVDIDLQTGMRAHVTHIPGRGALSLRSSIPLIRLHQNISTTIPRRQLPTYRVVIEAYPETIRGCSVGFIPSHKGANSTNSLVLVNTMWGYRISEAIGWWFPVQPERSFAFSWPTSYGWSAMTPRNAFRGVKAPPIETSSYATTESVPPLPAGGAVELAVDYAAGTCRVAFYTPEAVAGRFIAAPFATMELRFVATERRGSIPARAVPTEADPGLQLYPAVATHSPGAIWRFV
jgi:hypothetical protein